MPAANTQPVTILWFRQDLRLHDNPALSAAAERGAIVPVFILDDASAGEWTHGGASRLWLHHSLASLQASLDGALRLFRGKASEVLPQLVEQYGASAVYWNRCYEPWRRDRDTAIKQQLTDDGIQVESFNGSLLWEPWTIAKGDGQPYKVFTPYYRKGCLSAPAPRMPLAKPSLDLVATSSSDSLALDALELLPSLPWGRQVMSDWSAGESAASRALDEFLEQRLGQYAEGRDVPGVRGTSRISPHLHFGELSPNQVWYRAQGYSRPGVEDALDRYLSELGWREFCHYLLYHVPSLPGQEFNAKFTGFPWRTDEVALQAWQRGMTGVPLVDAGMRELWQTGFMHNRVRMVVASFLVKNLLVDWRAGQAWFWDCLLDADLANNSASWQWVAGSGADAAPYFRIFNAQRQGEKFDPQGDYVRRYVPELSAMPDKYVHAPWSAPAEVLEQAGVELGVSYPEPVADLKLSRERALEAYRSL